MGWHYLWRKPHPLLHAPSLLQPAVWNICKNIFPSSLLRWTLKHFFHAVLDWAVNGLRLTGANIQSEYSPMRRGGSSVCGQHRRSTSAKYSKLSSSFAADPYWVNQVLVSMCVSSIEEVWVRSTASCHFLLLRIHIEGIECACVWSAEKKYEYEVQQAVVFFCRRSTFHYDALRIVQVPVSNIVKRKYEFGVGRDK